MLHYDLQLPAFTVSEFEKIASLPKNTAYALIRQKKLRAVLDVNAQYRIPYSQACAFMERQDETFGTQTYNT